MTDRPIRAFLVAIAWSTAVLAAPATPIGTIELHDIHGNGKTIADLAKAKPVVVLFLGTECPLVRLYSPRLNQIESAYRDKGIAFIGVDANEQDSLGEIAQFIKGQQLQFPVFKDLKGELANTLGAVRTPEVVVLDSSHKIRYQGRIDDQYGPGYQRPEARRADLTTALDEVLAGKEVSVARTEATGCFIGRKKNAASDGGVTYASHIAAIFQKKCLECHRAGEIGPFSMMTYEEVAPWAETIREVIDQGRMPPWFADPNFGEFLHNPSLSDEEKRLIAEWVESGAPEGNTAQTPAPPRFTEGWLMEGTPDIVYKMSEKPFSVPAEGEIKYQYYTVEENLKEDMWVFGSEARPGSRSVVHHILVFCKRPGRWYPPGLPGELISAWAPGMKPTVAVDESMGLLLPKGSQIIMQVHYTPNGIPQEDISTFGIKVHPDPSKIRWEIKPGMAINFLFKIPAGADNHRVPAMFNFGQDAILLGVNPHMHKRGKSFIYEAVYPDGRRETIMNCPKFDFNWQLGYQYADPLKVPKGTKLVCTAYFDNSTNNPSNPDSTKDVGFGDQTWDEMMIGWFYYAVRVPPPAVASK